MFHMNKKELYKYLPFLCLPKEIKHIVSFHYQNYSFILHSPIQQLYFCLIFLRHSITIPNSFTHYIKFIYLFIILYNVILQNNIQKHI